MEHSNHFRESSQEGSDAPLLHDMKYSHLPASETGSEPEWQAVLQKSRWSLSSLLPSGIIVLLTISNLFCVLTLWSLPPKSVHGLEYPPHRTVHTAVFQDTPYGGIDGAKPAADALWKALFPSGNGLVSVSQSDQEEQNLLETWPDPDTPGNGLFFMAGYHNLHCLAKIRSSVFEFKSNSEQSEPWAHIVHCIDQIRQTMMCNFDTTLVPTEGPKDFIDGHFHVCKDYRDIFEWAGQHRPAVAPEDEEDER